MAIASSECVGQRVYRRPVERGAIITRPTPGLRRFCEVFRPLCGSSNGNVRLWQDLEKEIGRLKPYNQSKPNLPEALDCVSLSTAVAVDLLAASNIHSLQRPEAWVGRASPEALHSAARRVGRIPPWITGAHCTDAAKACSEVGINHQLEYVEGDETFDMRGYNQARAVKYTNRPLPKWVLDKARRNLVKEFTRVKTGSEALDAIAARQPVLLCSTYGFEATRDEQGFAKPHVCQRCRKLSCNSRIQWKHAMVLIGSVNKGGRIGGTVLNSAGKWNKGPQPDGMPDGSFNVDLDVLHAMVSCCDSIALSNYTGPEALGLKPRL